MSELILYEGGKKRKFPHIGELETDTQDGGTCSWIPEESATFEPVKIESNGLYVPAFAYSEVDVDVKEPINDYDFFIDEDGFPHIELDDLDLSFDLDGLPELTGGDFDLDDIDFGDFDFDSDYDISFDDLDFDLSGLDLDGLDIDLTLDLDTLELDEHELPDEIRIMHVPDKTSYQDGEEIDIEGIVVQAYRNGEVWEDPDGKYVDGYIPAHELIVDPTKANASESYISKIVEYTGSEFCVRYQTNGNICYINNKEFPWTFGNYGYFTWDCGDDNWINRNMIAFTIYDYLVMSRRDYGKLSQRGYDMYISRQDFIDGYALTSGYSKKYIEEHFRDALYDGRWKESETYPGLYQLDWARLWQRFPQPYPAISQYRDYRIGSYMAAICKPFFGIGIGTDRKPDNNISGSIEIEGFHVEEYEPSHYREISDGLIFEHSFKEVSFDKPIETEIIEKVNSILTDYIETGKVPKENEIKVSWHRPHDDKVLSATFDISVESDEEAQGGE